MNSCRPFEKAYKRQAQMHLLVPRNLISKETNVSEDERSFEKVHLGDYEWVSCGKEF